MMTLREARKKRQELQDNSQNDNQTVDNHANTTQGTTTSKTAETGSAMSFREARKLHANPTPYGLANQTSWDNYIQRYNSIVNDYRNLYKDYGSRYGKGYVQVGDTEYNDYANRRNKLDAAINTMDVKMARFKGYVSDDAYNSIISGLKGMRDGFEPLSEYVKNGTDFYGQFSDENQYNEYSKQVELQKVLEPYKNKTYSDLKKSIEQLKAEQDENPTDDRKQIIDALEKQWYTTGYNSVSDYDEAIADAQADVEQKRAVYNSNRANTPLYGSFSRYDTTQNNAQNADAYKNLYQSNSDLKTAEEKLSYLTQQKKIKENELTLQEKYGNITRNSDFEERSKIDQSNNDAEYRAVNGLTDMVSDARQMVSGGGQHATKYAYLAYQSMSDNERKTYNYIYNTAGKQSASEYLELLNMGQRSSDEIQKLLESTIQNGDAGTAALLSSITPIINTVSSVPNFILNSAELAINGEVNPYSQYNLARNTAQTIRSATSQKISESVDGFSGKALSEIYNAGMSVADNLLGMAATGGSPAIVGPLGAYDFIMGMGAASDTLVEAKQRGLSDSKAVTTSLAAGVFETLFEHVSLENLKALAASGGHGFKNAITNFLKQSFTEGSEEFFTDIANEAWDLWTNGGGAESEQKRLAYILDGKTPEEAERLCAYDFAKQLGESFIVGGMAGGMMSLGASGINEYRYHSGLNEAAAIKENGEVQNLLDRMSEADKNSAAYKFAQELSGVDVDQLTEQQIAKMNHAYNATTNAEASAKVSEQAKARLTELGVPKSRLNAVTKTVVDAYVNEKGNTIHNKTLSKSEMSAAQKVVIELSKADLRASSGDSISKAVSQYIEKQTGSTETTNPEYIRNSQDAMKKLRTQSDVVSRMSSVPVSEMATVDGDTVQTYQFSRVDGANSTVYTNSGELSVSDLNTQNSAAGALYETIANTADNTVTANAMLRHYNGQNIQQYVSAFNSMVKAGTFSKANISAEQAIRHYSGFAEYLGEDAAKAAFNVGKHNQRVQERNEAAARTAAEQNESLQNTYGITEEEVASLQIASANMDAAETNAFMSNYTSGSDVNAYAEAWAQFVDAGRKGLPLENAAESVSTHDITAKQARAAYAIGRQEAGAAVAIAQGMRNQRNIRKNESGQIIVHNGTVENSANSEHLSKKQKAAVDFVQQFSKLTGLNFVLFQSDLTGMNGKYLDGKIWLDLNSGSIGEQAVLRTLGHELTHFIQDFSPAQYAEFRSFLFNELNRYDINTVQRLMVEQINNAKENGIQLTETQALDEVVADACEMMLQDGSAIKKLAQSNLSTKEKIVAKINDLLDMIAQAFESVTGTSSEYAELREAKANFEELQKRWNEALADATETFNGTRAQQENGGQGSAQLSSRIQKGMTDAERYNILKEVSITAIPADYSVIDTKLRGMSMQELETAIKSKAEKPIREYAKKIGIIKDSYRNKDIGIEFGFTMRGLNKSLFSQMSYGGSYADLAKVFSVMDDVVSNAELIEVHDDYKKGTKKANKNLINTFVLMNAVQDNSDIIPVALEVMQLESAPNRLYVNVALSKIKKAEVMVNSKRNHNSEGTSLFSASIYSIRDLLKNINSQDGEFLKYVPDQFLNSAQKSAKQDALARRERKMAALKNEMTVSEKYSLRKSDTKYAELAKNPEKNAEQLRAMLAEAAKESGYDSPVLYHGTQNFGFTKFDLSKMDDGRSIFLTSSPAIASTYSGVGDSRQISARSNVDVETLSMQEVAEQLNQFPPDSSMDYSYSYIKSAAELENRVSADMEKLDDILDRISENLTPGSKEEKQLRDIQNATQHYNYDGLSTKLWIAMKNTSLFDGYEAFANELEQNIRLMKKASTIKGGFIAEKALDGYSIEVLSESEAREALQENMARGNYSLYAKLGNSLTVDAQGGLWNQLNFRDPVLDERLNTTRLVAEYAKGHGYDSVVFKNLRDNGGMNSGVKMDTAADIYVIFNPSDVKSADPVVRDNSGNVIPLSERFNSENEDIRYSTRKPTKTARQILSEVFSEQSDRYKEYAESLKGYQNTLEKLNNANTKLNELQEAEQTLRKKKPADAAANTQAAPYQSWAGYESTAEEDSVNLNALRRTLSGVRPEVTLSSASVNTMSRILAKSAGIQNSTELSAKLTEYYRQIVNGNVTWDSVMSGATDIAEWMVAQKSQTTMPNTDYADILADLKNTTLYLDDSMKAEIQYTFGSMNAYRKAIGNTIRFTNDPSAMHVESLWSEMSEKYPWAFDPSTTNSNDMAVQLKDVLETARTPIPVEFDTEAMTRETASEIYDGFWQIATVKSPDVKHREQIARLRSAHAKQLAKLKNSYQQTVRNLRQQMQEQTTAASELQKNLSAQSRVRDDIQRYESKLTEYESGKLKNVLNAERRAAVEAARNKGRQDLKDYRDARHATEVRNKIKRAYKEFASEMISPKQHKYIPQYLAPAMLDVLDAINLGETKNPVKWRENIEQKLLNLRDRYSELKTDSDPDYSSEFDSAMQDQLSDLVERFGDKSITDMSAEELENVYSVVKSIKDTIANAKKLIGTRERASVKSAAANIISQQSAIRSNQKNHRFDRAMQSASNFVNGQSISAMRNVERIAGYDRSSPLYRLFEDINDGVQKQNKFIMDTEKSFADLVNQKEEYNSAVGKKLDTNLVDINGNPVQMTKMQIMQTIMSWEREQANTGMMHMSNPKGGIVVLDYDLVKKGQIREATLDAAPVRLNETDIANLKALINDDFSQEFMRRAHEFFDGSAKDCINETMLRLKHFTVANDKSYIPFKVDSSLVVRDIDGAADIPSLIENAGILKEKQTHAAQPIVITGLNNVISEHKQAVAKIYGLAIPVRNFNKVWNATDEHGMSVKKTVGQTWNKYGRDVIEQAVEDIQRSRPRSTNAVDRAIGTLSSNFAAATLNFNLSVAMKQAASLQTAYLYLKHRNIVASTAAFAKTCKNYQAIINEIDEHTAQHYMRRIGLSTQELGDIATGLSTASRVISKIPTAINPTKWIQGIDCLTTATFWEMCKEDVRAQDPGIEVNSKEYWSKVTDLYDLVIEETQPMYDVLHRPELQKATGLSRYLVMFKTQPLQNAGIIWNSFGEMQAAKASGNAETYAASKTKFVKAVASQVESAAVFAVMTLVGRALLGKLDRYKDDDESTVWSYANRILLDASNSLAGVFLPPWGSDIESFIENAASGSWFSDDLFSVEALNQVNGLLDNVKNVFEKPSAKTVSKLIFSMTTLLGIPAQNAWNIVNGIITNTKSIARIATGETTVNQGIRSDVQEQVKSAYAERKRKYPGETDSELQKGAESSVRSKITSVKKKQYLAAYQAGNQGQMEDIVRYLNFTGLYSNPDKTVSGWVESYLDEKRRTGN